MTNVSYCKVVSIYHRMSYTHTALQSKYTTWVISQPASMPMENMYLSKELIMIHWNQSV